MGDKYTRKLDTSLEKYIEERDEDDGGAFCGRL